MKSCNFKLAVMLMRIGLDLDIHSHINLIIQNVNVYMEKDVSAHIHNDDENTFTSLPPWNCTDHIL